MKFVFLVEDLYGRAFFERFFSKKIKEGIFSGELKRVLHAKLSGKINAQIKANIEKADRIIIIADADDGSLSEKEASILKFVNTEYETYVKIVLLDYEIEEWICHSNDIKITEKPSKILKHRERYEKSKLPKYAEKIDCKKLQGKSNSFRRFVSSLAP